MSDPESTATKWASSVVLGSGDTAYVRPITVDDKDALLEFHSRQSSDSIYRRYFSPKATLSTRELEHFTNVDMVDRVALVLELQDRFVAWASYERWPGRAEADVAFMVDDEFHGHGMATLLLEHLAAIARANGIARFTAEVLGDNRAMLAVFAKAGWPLTRRFESGVVDLDWDLAPTDEFLDSVERREQRADSRAIARLLIPKAVAVIGASDRPHSVGAALWRHVVDGVDVPTYPVNPRLTEIGGHRCYAHVDDLPDDVSLGVVAVPPAVLEETIDACIAKRMRGAIVVTDIDGTDMDIDAVVARARRYGLRLIGPSSMGAASPRPSTRLQAALVNIDLPPGSVAISMQSGSLGGSVLRHAYDLGLGLSWFVSLGDKGDVSGNDLLQFWEDDENTRVIAMYTESFGNERKFARIARRVSRTRPIVAVRTGAAADGSLGSVLAQQAGLIEVPTVHALLDTARVLAGQPVLRGPNVALVSNSRSPQRLATAALRTSGLSPAATPSLPVDATPVDFSTAIAAALGDPDADAVFVIHAPAVASDLDSDTARSIDAAARGSTKPVVAVLLGSPDGPVRPGSPVPAFAFPEQAAEVLGRSYAYGRWLASTGDADAVAGRTVDPDAAGAMIAKLITDLHDDPVADASSRDDVSSDHTAADDAVPEDGSPHANSPGVDEPTVVADPPTAAVLLGAYGISMAPTALATPDTVTAVAGRIGYPVAVKAGRRAVGRSVKAGVALDLGDDGDVVAAVEQMREALGPGADTLVVQHMTAPGLDVRVRCDYDDRLGVIVSVGLGGAQADVIGDHSSRLAPVSPASAVAMLSETRVALALVDAGIDSSALVNTICLAAQLATDHPEISHLDLNPVVVSARDATVTDAVIHLRVHTGDHGPLRRID